ncbi:MAG: LysR family transcriptional regulator [Sphingobium sp.]|nr:LysR family transcriptional regulator [Sphingobium sp.]
MDEGQLNIRHLAAAAAIVRHGSISAASHSVNLTQPAITQGIAKLEARLGQLLFERRPGGMVPTSAGRLVAERAENALRLIGGPVASAAQIRAFVAVARTGSYSSAALETGLAEASLHRAVGDLSLAIGQRLIDRRGRGIVLTQRGVTIARNFRLALAELRSCIFELDALAGREIGRISVGAMPLSRARLLPNAVATFHDLYPQVDVGIIEGSYHEMIGPLRDGEVDLLLGALRFPHTSEEVVQTPLFADQPIILARAGHPLALGIDPVTVSDLERFPWIVPGQGTPLRLLWNNMFEAYGVAPPRVPIECGSGITIRQLLMQSDFLTLLSIDQVALEIEAGWLKQVGEAPKGISRMIGVTTRSDWRPTGLQTRFLEILKAEADVIAAAI